MTDLFGGVLGNELLGWIGLFVGVAPLEEALCNETACLEL